jgi:hypothetical protein
VSLHFEWTLSLWLRRDVPEEFIGALRADYRIGVLSHSDGSWLPGGPVANLVRQPFSADKWLWGLHLRMMVLDDEMYELIQTEPPRLARWSATQGWIGFAREELALHPWLNFYVQGGHAYAASPGQEPQALSANAPPFTLTQTTETCQ